MWLQLGSIRTRIDEILGELRQSEPQTRCSRGKEACHASAARCTTRPSVMARARGMVLEASYPISTSPRTFRCLHRRLCSLSSIAPTRTHPRRLPAKPPTYRRLSPASPSKPCASWCSSDAPYEHQPPVPIAHFGPRLRALVCESRDVPGVLPGVIGTERRRGWVGCSCAQAGTLLPAPPSRGMRVCAMLPWPGIVLSHKILWLRFFLTLW